MKKGIVFIGVILVVIVLSYQYKPAKQIINAFVTKPNYVLFEGKTVGTRAKVLEGYTRDTYPKNSFQNFIRHIELKPHDAPVVNYDGSHYFNQKGHIGVLNVSVPDNGLQQCADALIRLRSEYLWQTNQKQKIGFNFTSGHYCSWQKYAEGYRPKINGNKVSFHNTAKANHTKANFYKYLNLIYMYAGTMSLEHEMKPVKTIKELQVGDMLIIGGSPGHVIMIADVITNADGNKRFLLLQGNTPAQSIHILKNWDDPSISPWYELKIGEQVDIPAYTFDKAKFVRFK